MYIKMISVLACSILFLGSLFSCKSIDRSTVSSVESETSGESSSNSEACFSLSGSVDPEICQLEALIVLKSNQYRERNGLRALTTNKSLAYSARQATLTNRSIASAHYGFPSQRYAVVRQCDSANGSDSKLIHNLTGEIWAPGHVSTSLDATATAIVNMWIGSAPHRQIMVGSHTYTGVGVSKSGSNYYAIQLFGR